MISRSWTWLEQQQYVKTTATGRIRSIEPLREDGSGRAWIHPAEEEVPYFGVPSWYWRKAATLNLDLATKAVLLIGLSLQGRGEPFFELPVERGAAWYGLTPQSVRTGLEGLRRARLLRTWVERRPSTGSPTGFAYDRRHGLNFAVANTPADIDGADDIRF